jgi:hypothetical protein
MATALGTESTRADLVLQPGATLIFTIDDRAGVALAGSTASMKIRSVERYPVELLELTVGSGIDLGGTTGIITVTISAAQTAGISENAAYELLLTYPDTTVDKMRSGTIRYHRWI